MLRKTSYEATEYGVIALIHDIDMYQRDFPCHFARQGIDGCINKHYRTTRHTSWS